VDLEERVEHVGSLVATQRLVDALARSADRSAGGESLAEVEDDCIREVVARQEARGLGVVTDGELRRLRGRDEVAAQLADVPRFGVARGRRLPAGEHRSGVSITRTALPSDTPYGVPANSLVDEYRFTAGISTRPVKVALLGPDHVTHLLDPAPGAHVHDLFDAVLALEQTVVEDVVAAGCRHVQLDSPGYLAYADPVCVAEMRGRGIDPVADLRQAIEADNAVVAGAAEATVSLHMCRSYLRGVARSPVFDPFAEILFDQLVHRRLLVDLDLSQADAFAPLRFVPRDRQVVIGVVDSRNPRVETIEEVLRLVEHAGRWFPIDQLALSPTCGFAATDPARQIGAEEQWRKLDVLVEVASRVWG